MQTPINRALLHFVTVKHLTNDHELSLIRTSEFFGGMSTEEINAAYGVWQNQLEPSQRY